MITSTCALGVIEKGERFTQGLVACTPSLGSEGKRRLESITGNPPSLFQDQAQCRFAPRCGLAVDACWREEPPLVPWSGVNVACPVMVKAGSGDG